MARRRRTNALKEQVNRTVLKQMSPHLAGWVQVLGEAANSPNEKTRISAAKTGLTLAKYFVPEAESLEGDELMAQLLAIEKTTGNDNEEVPEAFYRDDDE